MVIFDQKSPFSVIDSKLNFSKMIVVNRSVTFISSPVLRPRMDMPDNNPMLSAQMLQGLQNAQNTLVSLLVVDFVWWRT